VAGELTNGRARGASEMHAEDVKAWLQGIKLEENPLVGPANVGAVEHWCNFIALVQAIWDHGEIPPPSCSGWLSSSSPRAGETIMGSAS
jgi:hypothetical protein